jgi:hypothetical protein
MSSHDAGGESGSQRDGGQLYLTWVAGSPAAASRRVISADLSAATTSKRPDPPSVTNHFLNVVANLTRIRHSTAGDMASAW